MASRSDRQPTLDALASQGRRSFCPPYFPVYWHHSFLVCPDDESAAIVLEAITRAARSKGVTSEIVDLRPAPADVLNAVTACLREFNFLRRAALPRRRRLLVLEGFDRLEGRNS